MGRIRGYGQLDHSTQALILRFVRIRKKLTNKALALRLNVSEQTVKGILARHTAKLVCGNGSPFESKSQRVGAETHQD